MFAPFSFYSTKPERRQLKFNNGAVLRHSLSSHYVVWRLIVFMRVRFLALRESPHRIISSKQPARCECESRRVHEPPGPGTSASVASWAPTTSDAANPWGSSSSTEEMPRAGSTLPVPVLPSWLGPMHPGSDSCPPQVIQG